MNTQADDGLLHFLWFERVGASEARGAAQIDSIILPGEASYSKVRTSATPVKSANILAESLDTTLWQVASAGPASRIYTLAFASDKDRNHFFWYGTSVLLLSVFQVLIPFAVCWHKFVPVQDARAQTRW